jgi:membrane protein implicated in regulation of membrane protease activity
VPSRTLIELLHLAAGLAATACITAASAWAYPPGRGVIEAVGWVAAGVVLAMYVDPVRRAWEADQRGHDAQ